MMLESIILLNPGETHTALNDGRSVDEFFHTDTDIGRVVQVHVPKPAGRVLGDAVARAALGGSGSAGAKGAGLIHTALEHIPIVDTVHEAVCGAVAREGSVMLGHTHDGIQGRIGARLRGKS